MEMRWRIELLGGLRVSLGERVITRFRTRKAGVLLAYLAFYSEKAHAREVLREVLWPEQDPEETRHKLRQALSTLRRQLELPGVPPGTAILTDRANVQLNPAAFMTDVAAFSAALQTAGNAGSGTERAQRLTEAAKWYRGELLPGYFEEWIFAERQRLGEQFQRALTQLIHYWEQNGDLGGAIEWARRAVTVDPLREEAHHELIRLLTTAGQREAARRQYRELERLLRTQLGEAPAPATRRLVDRPESERAAGAPDAHPGETAPAETGGVSGTFESGAAEPGALGKPAARSPFAAPPEVAAVPPTGTVTFLLTDIEGSTALWERTGSLFRTALDTHHSLLREEFRRHGGYEVKEAGDSFVVAFTGVAEAATCAVSSQRALGGHAWPEPVGPLSVRMALHTGDVEREKGEYRGLVLHHAARMLVAAHGGQIVCSAVTAGLLRHAAPGSIEPDIRLLDLGLYRLRDVAIPERLFQVDDAVVSRRRFPPLNVPLAHQGYLPLPLTRFFDREAEMARLVELLAPRNEERGMRNEVGQAAPHSCRLLTLTGAGGSGKTRLAVEAARRLADHFANTVYFVPLATLRDPGLIANAVREALQLPVAPAAEPLEQVMEALASGPALLVLDNFEHLREEGAPLVQALLERLPRLSCLLTSRQRLGLSGEQVFPVAPLPVPGVQVFRYSGVQDRQGTSASTTRTPEDLNTRTPEYLKTLTQCPSVQLFVDRAQAARPDFQITPRNGPAIAELCRRLDGIPLALELAAARARALTVPQMLAQLERRFEFLVGGRRDQPAHHQSLRAALDWSYHLLSPELQRFFARLSVFRGSWSLAAAEQICLPGLAANEAPAAAGAALDYLDELCGCSLILAEESEEEMRYRMFETVREYAREQLLEEERELLARRHAEYYLGLAERAEPELRGPDQKTWMARLRAKENNLWAALDWAVRHREPELGLRLGAALVWFWNARGRHTDVRAVLTRLLRMDEVSRARPASRSEKMYRARAIHAVGQLAWLQWDLSQAVAPLEEALTLYRELDDMPGAATVLGQLASVHQLLGHLAPARAMADESLSLWRQVGDPRGVGEALGSLAVLADTQGEYPTARALYSECLAANREARDSKSVAWALNCLGQVAQRQGDLGAAQAFHEESLEIWEALESPGGIGWSLMNLGHIARAEGDLETAASLYEQWETATREVTPGHTKARVAFSQARLALDRREASKARELLDQSLAVFEQQGEKSMIAHCHLNRGRAALLLGEHQTARTEFATALPMFAEMNDRWAIALSLEAFADLAAAQGEAVRAACLLGAADGLRETLGAPRPPIEQTEYERKVTALRAAMGQTAYVAAHAHGSALLLGQAIAEALRVSG